MTIFPEPLGKWIVVNLQLSDPLILVGGHTKELGVGEGGGGVQVVGHDVLQREHVRGRNNVESHVILVHRGQDKLQVTLLISIMLLVLCIVYTVYLHGWKSSDPYYCL